MAQDPLSKYRPNATSGCRAGAVITPDDDTDLAQHAKAVRAGGAGNLCFIPAANADVDTLTVTLADGDEFSMFQIRRILATGTTIATIIAGWD